MDSVADKIINAEHQMAGAWHLLLDEKGGVEWRRDQRQHRFTFR